MHSRSFAGWKKLALAAVVATLVLSVSTVTATPLTTSNSSSDDGGLGTVIGEEDGIKRPTLHARTNYSWPFGSGPFYGEATRERLPGMLFTQVGTFDLAGGQIQVPAELKVGNRLGELPAQHFVLQVHPDAFANGTFDSLRASIEAQGGSILKEMPVGAFIARLTPGALAAAQSEMGVLAVEPYHPAFKIAPTVGRVPLLDPFRAVSDVYTLDIVLHRGEDPNALASLLAGMGGNVVSIQPDAVRAEVHRDKLATVANIESVFKIFEHVEILKHAEETTTTMQIGGYCSGGGSCGAIPYHDAGIRGAGQVLMVLDSGIQLDGGDLSNSRADAGSPGLAHRKVLKYESTAQFGGGGDLLGCDAASQGAFTHGHTVSATALGWATDVDGTYGQNWFAEDTSGNDWKLDGVAPEAKLVAYDAEVTSSLVSCDDPSQGGLAVGNIYSGIGSNSSLEEAYVEDGARANNFSWGVTNNPVYGLNASRIDDYMNDRRDGVVFVSAGNDGSDDDNDLIRDPNSVSDPATCKNCLPIGSTGNANDLGTGGNNNATEAVSFFSSVGPGPGDTLFPRILPLLMAPGQERGNMGVPSEFSCLTADNDQNTPVQCDIVQGISGTSFSSPAASGAALLVRDYFAQGFYPDGTAGNPGNGADQVENISGALLKAMLVASADWVGVGNNTPTNSTLPYRGNRDQGFGRIQLDNVLPLQTWTASPVGLIVEDGDASANVDPIPTTPATGLGLPGSINQGELQSTTFNVCDPEQELRVALAWTEPSGQDVTRNLDLELEAPDGTIYYGNYFTDDNDRDRTLDAGEDCPSFDGTTGTLSDSPWSLATCGNSVRDTGNVVEAIMLTPDFDQDGNEAEQDTQIQQGDWTLRVRTDIASSFTGAQNYAVAVAGGVCLGSSARFNNSNYVCNSDAVLTVNETDEIDDPGASLTATEIASRTVVQVLDADGVVVDEETGDGFFNFAKTDPAGLQFRSGNLTMTSGTVYEFGNGALDVQDGNSLRVIYRDEANGSPDPDQERVNTADVDCSVDVGFGNLVFAKFGRNAIFAIGGGCEKNDRPTPAFEFGFPDEYMDAGEVISYSLAFVNDELQDLEGVEVELTCVQTDADSPEECLPGSDACADPDRQNNPACTELTIVDPVKTFGAIPAGSSAAATFTVEVDGALTGTPEIEMLLGVSSATAGKGVSGYAVQRHKLNVDEVSFFYNTDFPTGGTVQRDINNNEVLENPTENVTDFFQDYRFEEVTYSDLTAGNTINTGLSSPWNFDADSGNFRSGIGALSTESLADTVAQWGEDKNFNGILDAGEDRDPLDGSLSQNWSTQGGCGWVTNGGGGAGTPGGIWHTGRIQANSGTNCLVNNTGTFNGRCQSYEIISGATGVNTWFEILLTPEVQQVDTTRRVEIVNFGWNMLIQLNDANAIFTWEFDNNTQELEPIDLVADNTIFNLAGGPFGTLGGGQGNSGLSRPQIFGVNAEGFPVFAPFDGSGNSSNGTLGNNRVGENNCFFEDGTAERFGPPGPADDDIDNDVDGSIDEFVAANGPIRNSDLTTFNGPDLRSNTFEDINDESGPTFQGAFGFFVSEWNGSGDPPAINYGAGIDDVYIEWREIEEQEDTTSCDEQCASVDLDVLNFFEGSSVLNITLIEPFIGVADGTDCNRDGVVDGAEIGDFDCDNDGLLERDVEAFNDNREDSEVVLVEQVATGSSVYKGQVSISATFDVDGETGVLFVQRVGTDQPTVFVEYFDDDAGNGTVCNNDIDPAGRGVIQDATAVLVPAGIVSVATYTIDDSVNGDGDGIADSGEVVDMFITVNNNSGVDLNNLVGRLIINDDRIECVTQPVVSFDTIAEGSVAQSNTAFTFKVSDTASRASAFEDFAVELTVGLSADEFDTTLQPQSLTLDLDLDIAAGGGSASTFFEDFETTTNFGAFTSQSIDVGASGSVGNSDGYRCQYNDPDFINANSYGNTNCYMGTSFIPGFPDPTFDWHLHDGANPASAPDGGRAFDGSRSLHWGAHVGVADDDTTSFGQLDAVRTSTPIHLAVGGSSELSFYHQISLVDDRTVNSPGGETPDRGVVMAQLANNSGTATGNWLKLTPFENVHDRQGTDNFFECIFDPIDDGSNEDDFFDPSDPDRRLGPSSTCFPEFVFAFLGDTDYRRSFDPSNTGRATDTDASNDEVAAGSINRGTWVRSTYDLKRFQGRSLRLRFLTTSIQVQPGIPTIEDLFDLPAGWVGDDGWYIDAVQVTNTVTQANTVSVDSGGPTGSTVCANNCTTLTASLNANDSEGNALPLENGSGPAQVSPAPGKVVVLSAVESSADTCIDGVIQYQFWIDGDANGVLGDPADTLLRDYSDNPSYTAAPNLDTQYGVVARCSSAPACGGADAGVDTQLVIVTCPTTGSAGGGPFGQEINADTKSQFSWAAAANSDVIQGDLDALRTNSSFTNSVNTCIVNSQVVSSFSDGTTPAAGSGLYYLVRGGEAGGGTACNAGTPSYSTGAASERAGRDSEIGADPNTCP